MSSSAMRPATSLENFEEQVRGRMKKLDHRDALVSIVFAPPAKIVFADLAANYDYLNLRSGTHWDVYFAGYQPRRWGRFPAAAGDVPSTEYFDPNSFAELVDEVEERHACALADAADAPPGCRNWHYSGGCDLVSLLAYRSRYRILNWDWLSLRGVTMTDSNGAYRDGLSLGEVTETARRWREDPAELARFGPGEAPATAPASVLGPALASLGALVATGVAQNAAYDVLKGMTAS